MIRVTDANGNSDYVRDDQGQVVKTHLNEALLQQIATATGGFYLPLRGADTMDMLYQRGLAPLPKSEGSEKLIRRYHEQFQWSLAAAMLLLLAEMFLPERDRPRATSCRDGSKRPVSRGGMAVAGVLPHGSSPRRRRRCAITRRAITPTRLQEYERLAEIHTNDLRLVFNAGAAAYRATNFNEALQEFQSATLSPDLPLQQKAFYNLGNTQFRLGEQKFEPDTDGLNAMEETWTQAATSYAHAVQLNTNDLDAAYNWHL